MEVLGVIPARGGSKGIPRKNLAPLGGKPLIAYTCDAARGSKLLTRAIVSTADETPMIDVVLDALPTLDRVERYRPDVVVLLQPTSPMRRSEHVDAALELLESSKADSVVTVLPVPHQFSPTSLLRLDGNRVRAYGDAIGAPTRRQ